MLLLRTTSTHDRRSVRLTRTGIVARIERPKVGGGYYPSHLIVVPWPWTKED